MTPRDDSMQKKFSLSNMSYPPRPSLQLFCAYAVKLAKLSGEYPETSSKRAAKVFFSAHTGRW